MTCSELTARIGPYTDQELDPEESREFERHLAACPECAGAVERQQALRQAVRQHVPSFRAPASLRASIHHAITAERRGPRRAPWPSRPSRPAWQWLAAAAVLIGVVVGTWNAAGARARRNLLTEELLAAHVRSLVGTHLTDVVSSDQHTVKPWFNGKIDYSPSVVDLSTAGFPLVGGRLEYVADRRVAALVYARRQHMISVFLWPTERGPTGGPASATRQGYHILHWSGPENTYWVLSDLGTAELSEFARLLRSAASSP